MKKCSSEILHATSFEADHHAYFTRLFTAVADGWNAFWYTPADPTLLGLIRILTGLMLLYTHAVWGLALCRFLRPGRLDQSRSRRCGPTESLRLLHLVVRPSALDLAGLCAHDVFPGTLHCSGSWTRHHVGRVALDRDLVREPCSRGTLFGLDKINSVLTFYLAVGPSGGALSVDRWLARRRQRRTHAARRDGWGQFHTCA